MNRTRVYASCVVGWVALLGRIGLLCAAQTAPPVEVPSAGVLRLEVDATDLAHHVFRAHEAIPTKPGPLTLLYPQWLPGDHSPSGPIDKFAGLVIRAQGKTLQWQRNSQNVYAFHVEVPKGVAAIEVEFQYLSPFDTSQGRVVMTPEMLNLQWNTVALYPAGPNASRVQIAASAMLPKDWGWATALESDGVPSGGVVHFKTVDFATLVDSPVFAGRYFKRIDLDPDAHVPVHLDLFADEPKYLEVPPELLQGFRALVQQEYRLHGSYHYDHYDFLLALSNKFTHTGIEHSRSSENGTDPEYFANWSKRTFMRTLLPHEYTHSWNGKFRRPVDLATPNFNVAMGDSLLWVYEGLTEYWGNVLTARAGLQSVEQTRDELALVAATYSDNRPGFSWRNIQDTTNDPVIWRRPPPYLNYRMNSEYYAAGALVWLAVDTELRTLSHGKRSLDDFARAFFGGGNGAWTVKTYDFDELVATLNAIVPHDWARFLHDRVNANSPPLDGLAAAGWRLVYTEQPSEAQKSAESFAKATDLATSIGLTVSSEGGKITDVRWNGLAFNAGIAPGGALLAVNGSEYSSERLVDALREAATGNTPIELLVKSGDHYKNFQIDYREGPKYPHLERIPGTADWLGTSLAPR